MACVDCMDCIYGMDCITYTARIARQTTFFLFPILIIPVLDMESPQRDPWHPTLPTTIHAGPDSTHDETDYHLLIFRMDAIQISPRIALYASSYHLQTSPIPAGPNTEQVCASGKSLSGRTCRSIRPAHATQSRTVLHHRDTDRITSSMPYHDPQSKKAKR